MHGHDVRVLQGWLTRLGLATAVDGRYGRATARTVRNFERREGQRVDGRVSRVQARGIRSRIEHPAPRTPMAAAATATLAPDGRTAIAPAGAPPAVVAAIAAANRITDAPVPLRRGTRQGRGLGLRLLGRGLLRADRRRALARAAALRAADALRRCRARRLDHGLRPWRPRLRRDRRTALRYVGPRRERPALAARAAFESGVHGPASGGALSPAGNAWSDTAGSG